mmetsp:Transcript_18678/g.37798  ORF Transcript_18678/g.37798 Transcript_18678/m.37798 type:complete len:84 (+) Transcript_18678:210-461(+)
MNVRLSLSLCPPPRNLPALPPPGFFTGDTLTETDDPLPTARPEGRAWCACPSGIGSLLFWGRCIMGEWEWEWEGDTPIPSGAV